MQISHQILYKNNQLIAFNKPPAIAVQPDKTGDKALIDLAEIYCKSRLQLIHRIDRPASGVVLFGKTKKAVVSLNEQFQKRKVEKIYLAVVGQKPESPQGELIHHLVKNGRKNQSVIVSKPTSSSKEAILIYNHVGSIERYHLLKVQLVTGRHHQIRAQLGVIGCPIKGDVKYGFRRGNRDRSIHLHCWKMRFRHPVSGEMIELTAPLPEDPVWEAFKDQEHTAQILS